MNKGGYVFKRLRCVVCQKYIAENHYIRHLKQHRMVVDLNSHEQLRGAIKVTRILCDDGVITASRAAELCGMKLMDYRKATVKLK